MIVPDDHALAARITAAVDSAQILAVQDHVVECVVLDHAVQRGCRISDNGEVQCHVCNVINFVVGERVLHTAEFHAALVEHAILVCIVDTAARNEVVARRHGHVIAAVQIDGRDGRICDFRVLNAGVCGVVDADCSALKIRQRAVVNDAMIDTVHHNAALFRGGERQTLEVEVRGILDRDQVKIAARHAERRSCRCICEWIDIELAARLVIVPLARLVQRFVGVIELRRLQAGGTAVMNGVRRGYDAGLLVEHTVEVVQRPAVGDIAGIDAVGFAIIPAKNGFVRHFELGIAVGRLRGIDRLDMHPVLRQVGVRVARQAHMLSIQREKRRVDAEVDIRQANVDRTQPKVAEACHHDVLLRVR